MADRSLQTEHRIGTPDGRRLRAFDAGDPDGAPVIFHHGTPMCGRLPAHEVEDAAAHGLRLISFDRPGYGGSTRHAGMNVGASALNTRAVADHFELGLFATFGASGGGPHALAAAALMPDRVVAAAIVAGDAPFDAEGLDWMEGMGELNAVELDLIRQGSDVYFAYLREQAEELAQSTPDDLGAAMASLLSPVDRAALTDEVAAYLHATMREAIAPGVEGWGDESLAIYLPWGFDVASIDVPVRIWHGSDDRFVPVGHGRWLASHIPGSEFDVRDGQGHVSLIQTISPDVHGWLAGQLALR